VLSLRSKIREQEIRKQTIRGNAAAEEQKLQSNIQEFDLSMKHLGTLTYQIDQYATSDKPSEQRRIGSILADYADQVQSCKASLVSLQPQLDSIRSIVNDHERRKRQLEYNIQMLEERNIITELRNQKKVTEAELQQIEYHDTVSDELRDAQDDKTKLLEAKNQMEGRFSEIVDRIRGLKRKLMQPEHRDVDKKHRNAKVEYETTHMAADDLKTYQKALDSALLQFHAKKLAEINSAVRQLWMACYKGEDITSIEIQSGQEPGARAQKSYNYRVVMSKGATELDMRGRCSAGQRVLAVRFLSQL
jgi:DNA repair protein RAD50